MWRFQWNDATVGGNDMADNDSAGAVDLGDDENESGSRSADTFGLIAGDSAEEDVVDDRHDDAASLQDELHEKEARPAAAAACADACRTCD